MTNFDIANFRGYVLPDVPIPEGVPRFKFEDYIVLREFGQGGTGFTSKATHKLTGQLYIIKDISILSDELTDIRHQKHIQHDMVLATSLNHPNVMPCLGVCIHNQCIYFLYNYMEVSFYRKSIKDERQLAEIAYQVLQGLDYLRKEKGLVFKHLTPGNILFDPVSNLYKTSDVGIVKDKYITLRYVEIVISYLQYIAPENYHPGNHLADLQSDLYRKSDAWSLGLCLLQLYNNGRYPLDLEDDIYRYLISRGLNGGRVVEDDHWPPKPPSDVSPLFRDFLSSCLDLDVSRRASVDQLLTHDFLVSNGFVRPLEDHLVLPLVSNGSISRDATLPTAL